MQDKLTKADKAVKTSEAWWSFLQQLWEARTVVLALLTGAGFVTSALWKAVDRINNLGWPGWVLASIPGILIVGLIAWFLNWVYHSVQLRKIKRKIEDSPQINPPNIGPSAISEGTILDGGTFDPPVDALYVQKAIADGVQGLTEQFDKLKEHADHLATQREVDFDKFKAHKDRSEVYEKQINLIIKAIGFKMVLEQVPTPEKIDEFLDGSLDLLETNKSNYVAASHFNEKRFRINFEAVEGDLKKLKQTIEDDQKRIMQDATYINLLDDERATWKTPEDKRNHFLTVAVVKAKKVAYRHAYERLVRNTQLDRGKIINVLYQLQ